LPKKHYVRLAEKYLKEEAGRFKYPAIYYDLARLYLYKNKSDSVLFYLNGYHRMFSSDSKILIWMAYTCLDLKQTDKADKLISEMRAQGVEVPQALEKLTYKVYALPRETNKKILRRGIISGQKQTHHWGPYFWIKKIIFLLNVVSKDQ
jgi:hypothetical protein